MTGCDSAPPSNITFLGSNPKGDTSYSPPDPISLECQVSPDVNTIIWIRNNSDGGSKILNSAKFENLLPFPGSPKVAKLKDIPPDEKFPYTYQCIAFGKCCDEIRSSSITVNFGK